MHERTVLPRLLPSGHIVCPACRKLAYTPTRPHPDTGELNKMVLIRGTCKCPHCGTEQQIGSSVARWHNAVWYNDNSHYAPGRLFDPDDPPPRIRLWTWRKATASLPFLRPLVADLRAAFCRQAHARLVARREALASSTTCGGESDGEVEELLDEIAGVGVLLHGGPLRGTVLFPTFTHRSGNRPQAVYLVWRDSREAVDAYVTADAFRTKGDIAACERPVPRTWRWIE